MGVYAVQWAFQAPIPSPGAKFLLVALAEHARDGGDDGWTCFPSIKRLSKWTAQGERTIERHLGWLIADGWISRASRRRKRHGESAYFYTLHRANLGIDDDCGRDRDEPAERKPARLATDRRVSGRQIGADLPPISTRSSAKANLSAHPCADHI